MKDKLLTIVKEAVVELNERLDNPVDVDKGVEALLYGKGAPLDSLSLVSLISDVEEAIEDDLDVSIVIANEKAMSRERSPFRTVGSLVDYALELIEAKK